jgi:hypothetical protein
MTGKRLPERAPQIYRLSTSESWQNRPYLLEIVLLFPRSFAILLAEMALPVVSSAPH